MKNRKSNTFAEDIKEMQKSWEKIMGKRMTHDEFVMFEWGYMYAILKNYSKMIK